MTLTAVEELKDTPAIATRVGPGSRWEEIGRLSMSLFDLRAVYESNLRTLTAMQRSLERVRRVDSLPCEADLLLGEIARHLQTLASADGGISETLQRANRSLDAVRCAPSAPTSDA